MRLIVSTVTGLACLVLAACPGSDESSPPAQPNADRSADDLRGRGFTSTAVTEDGEPRPLVPGTRIRVSFEQEEHLRWSAGCNDFEADVNITPDRLLVGEIASTREGCPDDLQRQDEWVAEFFGFAPGWEVTNGGLALTAGERVIEFDSGEPD